jgi:hypothetical protein
MLSRQHRCWCVLGLSGLASVPSRALPRAAAGHLLPVACRPASLWRSDAWRWLPVVREHRRTLAVRAAQGVWTAPKRGHQWE